MLDAMDPEVEWYPVIPLAFGEATVIRGHEAILRLRRDETTLDYHYEFNEMHDLGDRLVAIGTLRKRGAQSGLDTESPLGYVVDFKDGKIIRARGYFDPAAALEAAGLRE
jgi:ketosteroid isomerase-like protein